MERKSVQNDLKMKAKSAQKELKKEVSFRVGFEGRLRVDFPGFAPASEETFRSQLEGIRGGGKKEIELNQTRLSP